MYTHLLVATDGSKLSRKAVTHAIELAQAVGAKLTAFYASPEYPIPIAIEGVSYSPITPKEYISLCKKEADKILKPISLKAQAAGVEFDSSHVVAASPWAAILAAAKKNKCDGIVMASHGRRGVSALLLGSETQKVLTHSKLATIVVH
jgi:nucleotide-binding universal stress UspA family protein